MKFHIPVLSVLEQAIQDGLKEGMGQVLKRSDELAPEDTGEMSSGGFVHIDDMTGQAGYKTTAGYPYIKDQHENLDLQHVNGGQAKFLETAFEETDMSGIIAKHVRGALGG